MTILIAVSNLAIIYVLTNGLWRKHIYQYGSTLHRQIVGFPLGTNFFPIDAD